jgi:protein-S-isoprenylcysteine O-methyltransferase Ste14
MDPRFRHTAFLFVLALVFTVGLTFATVELPYLADDLLQGAIPTPAGDSHADELARTRTELFISHYHLRAVGYVCFGLMVSLIVAGFATRRTGLATAGALTFMLPVFAQFAGVMFFLAGLGLLNLLWLPVLDVSLELARLGLIIRAPYDLLIWLARQLGFDAYWPLVYACVGTGLLLFLLGTFAWLSARARQQPVADFWVYRISRHPQYLGWIVWSYGVYLLLLRGTYPRRSWGIDASLPWLVSTIVIIGVAMIEELTMRGRHGEAYEAYGRSAPFLFPVPRFVERLLALPFRILFGTDRPRRKGDVVVVLSLYAVGLIGASWFIYGNGMERTRKVLAPAAAVSRMDELATRIREEPNARTKYFIARELAAYGDPSVDHFVRLLDDNQAEVRVLAAQNLQDIPAERAISALVKALEDSVASVRGNVVEALGAIRSQKAREPMLRLLDDPEAWVRGSAMRSLAELGAEEIVSRGIEMLQDPEPWIRAATVESLGILGSERALPSLAERLNDEEAIVRRAVVIAMMNIGSTEARAPLERAAGDEDWEVRVYAAEALRRLSQSSRERD